MSKTLRNMAVEACEDNPCYPLFSEEEKIRFIQGFEMGWKAHIDKMVAIIRQEV